VIVNACVSLIRQQLAPAVKRHDTNDPDTPYLEDRTAALLDVMQEVRVP